MGRGRTLPRIGRHEHLRAGNDHRRDLGRDPGARQGRFESGDYSLHDLRRGLAEHGGGEIGAQLGFQRRVLGLARPPGARQAANRSSVSRPTTSPTLCSGHTRPGGINDALQNRRETL